MSDPNPEKLEALVGQMLGDMGAASAAPLVVLGDRLGLYKSLTAHGPLTTTELADKTGTTERYIREWCSSQCGYGYIDYDPVSEKFSMSPEQSAVFADDDSPVCMIGGYYAIAAMANDEPKITQAFKTGEGVGWGEHCSCLFCGTEKFFKPSYKASLIDEWIPALEGVQEKLTAGAKVADIGCGHGASTIEMAKAFPNSDFVGFDFHQESIDCSNERARDLGLSNLSFEVATAKHFPGNDYDLVAFFDCLHDMGDPVGAMAHVKQALKPDGTVMLIEPFANDTLEENMNIIGRMFYAFSTFICTPASISQEVGLALGAQAGPKRLENVAKEGGFKSFRVASQTPFNLICEIKP